MFVGLFLFARRKALLETHSALQLKRKMYNVQIPIHKSMVYKQANKTYKINEHFYTKHGKTRAHRIARAYEHAHTHRMARIHNANKEHMHVHAHACTAQKDVGLGGKF